MLNNILLATVPLIPLYLAIYFLFLMRSDFDLTLVGSFTVGGAVTAAMLKADLPVGLAVVASIAAGAALGAITTLLSVRLKIPVFLVGLVMSIACYTVAVRIMGKSPTLSLLSVSTMFSGGSNLSSNAFQLYVIGVTAAVVLASFLLVGLFLKTELGLALRASGINPLMARSNGFNDKFGLLLALLIGNGLAGLAGTLAVQVQSFASATGAQDAIIGGLGGVVVGALIIRPSNSTVLRILLAVVIGGFVYQSIAVLSLRFGLDPVDIDLVTGAILIAAIAAQQGVRRLLSLRQGNGPLEEPSILGGGAAMNLASGILGKD